MMLEYCMMIEIDKSKCTACRRCADICHTQCISMQDGAASIDYRLCSTCCQCIAICPEGALTWDGKPPQEIKREKLPDYDSLLELLKARRTHRRYEDKPVEKDKLELICQGSRYAPTNVFIYELIVVTDQALIKRLEEIVLAFYDQADRMFFSHPFVVRMAKKITTAIDDVTERKFRLGMQHRQTFHHPPAMIFIVADHRIPYCEQSCQYITYNMILIAETLGLVSCILYGGGDRPLNRSKEARQLLGIEKSGRILGILGLGYPKITFERTFEGNYPMVHWK
jgi:Fe-S-cluster-containing hydrogenase component 2